MTFKATDDQLKALVAKASSITSAKVNCVLTDVSLLVRISKWGTSVLCFTVGTDHPHTVMLTSQQVAWQHYPFIGTVKQDIADLVTGVGGTVVDIN